MNIIILAGGSGTRLWPLSRTTLPKQLLSFGGERSLLQNTLARYLLAYPADRFAIVANETTIELLTEQVEAIDKALTERIILEPESRNTAPAILLALKWLQERKELGATFLVAPSDHILSPEEKFLEKVAQANLEATSGKHILFGIHPTHPHTGYGYIQCDSREEFAPVKSFIEKPPLPKAEALLQKGESLWNSGIFVFNSKTFFQDLKTLQPDMHKFFSDEVAFESLAPLSIDHALLELTPNLRVMPLDVEWSDVGSWDSLAALLDTPTGENVLEVGSKNCLVLSKKVVATIDVEDLIIIDTEDALLIMKKGASSKLPTLIHTLREKHPHLLREHMKELSRKG